MKLQILLLGLICLSLFELSQTHNLRNNQQNDIANQKNAKSIEKQDMLFSENNFVAQVTSIENSKQDDESVEALLEFAETKSTAQKDEKKGAEKKEDKKEPKDEDKDEEEEDEENQNQDETDPEDEKGEQTSTEKEQDDQNDGEQQKGGGLIKWATDMFTSDDSQEENEEDEDSSFVDDVTGVLDNDVVDKLNPLDGEMFEFIQTLNNEEKKDTKKESQQQNKDGQEKEDGEQEQDQGFIDWLGDVLGFGDGEEDSSESSLIPDLMDGELLDKVNPLDQFVQLSSTTTEDQPKADEKKQEGAEAKNEGDKKEGEGETKDEGQEENNGDDDNDGTGFFDWMGDLLDFDGESSTEEEEQAIDKKDEAAPANDEKTEEPKQEAKSEAKFVTIKSNCQDPVTAKFGKAAVNQGQWKFNDQGNQYGVEYQGDFLALVQFDQNGNGNLLFKNDCNLPITQLLQNNKQKFLNFIQKPKQEEAEVQDEKKGDKKEDKKEEKQDKSEEQETEEEDEFASEKSDGENEFDANAFNPLNYIPGLDGEWDFFGWFDWTDGEFGFIGDTFGFLDGEGNWNPLDGEMFDGEEISNPLEF